jgi:hypothetical protein
MSFHVFLCFVWFYVMFVGVLQFLRLVLELTLLSNAFLNSLLGVLFSSIISTYYRLTR